MLDRAINRSLRRLDPTQFPRDPAPARIPPTIPVYAIGATLVFFQLDNRRPRHSPGRWDEMAGVIAYYFQCAKADVGTREMADGTELITVRGNVVGSFDHPVVLAQLLAESALTDGPR